MCALLEQICANEHLMKNLLSDNRDLQIQNLHPATPIKFVCTMGANCVILLYMLISITFRVKWINFTRNQCFYGIQGMVLLVQAKQSHNFVTRTPVSIMNSEECRPSKFSYQIWSKTRLSGKWIHQNTKEIAKFHCLLSRSYRRWKPHFPWMFKSIVVLLKLQRSEWLSRK